MFISRICTWKHVAKVLLIIPLLCAFTLTLQNSNRSSLAVPGSTGNVHRTAPAPDQSGLRKGPVHMEPELAGWERSVSRNASVYICYEENTALITPEIGKAGSNRKVLIAVFTDPKRIEYRSAIRQTSGKDCREHPDCDLLFLVGIPEADNDNRDDQRQLDREAELYKDILQENFNDTYLNFTIKALFLLKYVEITENSYTHVFKVNDDTFFSVASLFGIIPQLRAFENEPTMIGHVWPHTSPLRTPGDDAKSNRWLVPYYHYPYSFYPKFIAGSGYLMNRAAVKCHYQASLQEKLMLIEDVYITGILGNLCNTKRLSSPAFHAIHNHLGFQPKDQVTFHEATPEKWLAWYKLIPKTNASKPLQSYVPRDFQFHL